jgi:hypothetical protein
MDNVVYLHGQPQEVAQFLRIGSSNHRVLEQLLAAGRLPVQRFVVDAGALIKQADLISALRQSGRELVLDPNVAELSCIGRFQGAARAAPWADPTGPLTSAHFRTRANEFDIIGKIARFTVEQGIRRVQAPTHLLLGGVQDELFAVDSEACRGLRAALDIEGGRDVAIDYPLMISNATLNDPAERKAFLSVLASLPIDSLWLRISGFGSGATAVGMRKYISATQDFHVLQKPIISDGIGGVAALAVVSFGAASGVAHGVAEKERFDASEWNKPPKSGGGGSGYNILLPGIDRLLKRADAEALLEATGARRLLSCHDRACCPHGFEDTLRDPKGHYLRHRARQYGVLSAIPEQQRAPHFLNRDLAAIDRAARQAAKFKVSNPILGELLSKNAARLDRVRAVLEDLYKTAGATMPPPRLTSRNDNQASKKN